MLISGRRKGVPIMVTDKGACIFLHALRIRRTEIFSYSVYRPIDYPTEDRRILIISPVPVSVLGSSRAKITTLDNGVTVDKYKVYSGTAFLNALERACLER